MPTLTTINTTCAMCPAKLTTKIKTIHGYVCPTCYVKKIVSSE